LISCPFWHGMDFKMVLSGTSQSHNTATTEFPKNKPTG